MKSSGIKVDGTVIIGQQDAYILFSAGLIKTTRGRVVWLRKSYDGCMNDVKTLAEEGMLVATAAGLVIWNPEATQ